MNNKGTNRYITKSDRLVVYRHPVAREYADETLNSIREKWWLFEKLYERNPSKAGLRMYQYLQRLFGKEDVLIIEDDEFDCVTDYEEKDVIDWWDLADTEKCDDL